MSATAQILQWVWWWRRRMWSFSWIVIKCVHWSLIHTRPARQLPNGISLSDWYLGPSFLPGTECQSRGASWLFPMCMQKYKITVPSRSYFVSRGIARTQALQSWVVLRVHVISYQRPPLIYIILCYLYLMGYSGECLIPVIDGVSHSVGGYNH